MFMGTIDQAFGVWQDAFEKFKSEPSETTATSLAQAGAIFSRISLENPPSGLLKEYARILAVDVEALSEARLRKLRVSTPV